MSQASNVCNRVCTPKSFLHQIKCCNLAGGSPGECIQVFHSDILKIIIRGTWESSLAKTKSLFSSEKKKNFFASTSHKSWGGTQICASEWLVQSNVNRPSRLPLVRCSSKLSSGAGASASDGLFLSPVKGHLCPHCNRAWPSKGDAKVVLTVGATQRNTRTA